MLRHLEMRDEPLKVGVLLWARRGRQMMLSSVQALEPWRIVLIVE